jgi:Na+-transporting NADH:ubiquinone oxidoreductase subunit F
MMNLVLSLLALSGMGALLALLLEIADSFLADYGEKHVLINDDKDLVVEGGNPLLFSLGQEGIFIPSACGGKGTCAYCKVRITEGGGPVLPTERPYLTPDELEGHVRLSCQVKVKEDLKIRIPEELFLVKEFRVRVEHMEDLTPDIRSVRFRILSPEEGIAFKPGQYVQLQIPRYERSKEEEFRAYSISSSAGEPRAVELVITRMPEGIVSTYVHDFLNKGDELVMTGPFGDFYLRESDREILMIATGSGLAPFLSMVDQMEREKVQNKVTLFFGDRRPFDLYYVDRLRGYEKRIPRFMFVPTLSRATEEDQWEGEKGRVTDLIRKYIPDKADLDVYICGSPAMVQSCKALLTEKGIPEERILFDEFG